MLLRKAFVLRDAIARARLYATAHGLYDLRINGAPVGTDVLTPGWTSYRHRLRYHTYDVTSVLRQGDNVFGATVADGWSRGRLGFAGGVTRLYGDRLALVAQLEVTYIDGSTDVILTDADWTCFPGPVMAAGLYEGERHDARLERDDGSVRPGQRGGRSPSGTPPP